jgi:CDP-diacylglycerol---glycerol-3-phosphate 3-phosphatidyltransferase
VPLIDLGCSLVLFGLAAVVLAVWLFTTPSLPRFERLEREGASPLLGRRWMELGYWALQPIGRFLAERRFTANSVTWASFGFALLAGVAMASGWFGLGALLATAASSCDALDGLVARLSSSSSRGGEVLDASVDRYGEFFFLAGTIVHYGSEVPVAVGGLLALIGSFMVSYSSAKAEALGVVPPRGPMRRVERAVYLVLGAALCPIAAALAPHDLQRFADAPMVLVLCVVALLANASAALRLRAVARAARSPNPCPRHSGNALEVL